MIGEGLTIILIYVNLFSYLPCRQYATAALASQSKPEGKPMCNSRYLADFWAKTRDELVIKFMQMPEFQLMSDDRKIAEQARQLTAKSYRYKVCHYGSVALLESGTVVEGVHFYCRRNHEFSLCAESSIVSLVHRLKQTSRADPIRSIATYHASHDKFGERTGPPYVVAPCERCVRLLEEVSPDALVITDLDAQGRLAKVPLEACHLFRHPRRHNGEA